MLSRADQALSWILIAIAWYMGFEAYSSWSVFALGAADLFIFWMIEPSAIAMGVEALGLLYIPAMVVFNALPPAIPFIIGRVFGRIVNGV